VRKQAERPRKRIVGSAADAVLGALDRVGAIARQRLKQSFLGAEVVRNQPAWHARATGNCLNSRAVKPVRAELLGRRCKDAAPRAVGCLCFLGQGPIDPAAY
jgi:hypothetical protein